jgi:3'-phosphoadenosine 5'-phosphosulfate sulfotransferase (PAPS reductase)/FAD synthetase
MNHIVAVSGGKDSTAMALRLAELGEAKYQFCITPTGRELPPMLAHWAKLECLLGQPLLRVPGPDLLELIKKYRAVPNWRMRWCTRQIKIEPFMAFAAQAAPAICYVGIRADEARERDGTDWNGIEHVRQATPLVEWGWNLGQVKEYLRQRKVIVPARTDCDICFFQRTGEWWTLWRDYPERWREGEALEEWTGHTFRSAERDSWPVTMKEMRQRFEIGEVPKGANQLSFQLDVSERPAMCAWCAR